MWERKKKEGAGLENKNDLKWWKVAPFYDLIVLALGRLPAGVCYLSLSVIWRPLSTHWFGLSKCTFISFELSFEVLSGNFPGFWCRTLTKLEIPVVSGSGSKIWCLSLEMFLLRSWTHFGHWRAWKHCAYIQVQRIFWIKLIAQAQAPWQLLNSVFPSLYLGHLFLACIE